MKKIRIYLDLTYTGSIACGTGKYGAILEYIKPNGAPATLEQYGAYQDTTKNRLAILALIAALKRVREPCRIQVYQDNIILTSAINDHLLQKWQEAGWKRARDETVRNADLLQQLFDLAKPHEITVECVSDTPFSSHARRMLEEKETAGLLIVQTDREYKQQKMEVL